MLVCVFVAAAGIWLAVMENILKHEGYAGRSAVAGLIVLQAIGTLAYLWLNGRAVFRSIVATGAVLVVLFGVSAILKILRAQHFEGFVLVIGLALVLQGVLTAGVLLRAGKRGLSEI